MNGIKVGSNQVITDSKELSHIDHVQFRRFLLLDGVPFEKHHLL